MECKLYAIHNHMPGHDRNKSLRVGGTCEAPTPGYTLSLRPGNGGINPDPSCVYLELVVKEPDGAGPDVMTTTEVEDYWVDMAAEKKKVVVHGAEPGEIEITHPRSGMINE